MQEDKSPGYDEEEANEIQRAKKKRKKKAGSETKCQPLQGGCNYSVCVVQLLYINGLKASVK